MINLISSIVVNSILDADNIFGMQNPRHDNYNHHMMTLTNYEYK